MPRRFLHFPTYRNLQLYHEFVTERRTQVALAQRWRISQCRVSQITRRVKNWVDGLVPPRRFAGEPDKRFHLAVALERIRLREAYDPLVEMFTGPDGQPRLVRKSVTVVGGEARRSVEISEQTDFRLLSQAVDVQGRLAELEAIANLGPLADLPNQIHQTTVHRVVPAEKPAGQTASMPGSNTTEKGSTAFGTASNAFLNPSETSFNARAGGERGVLG
jgi:hypothetical protein